MDQLVTLPGVGRKTANVVLGNAFGIPGITVDTHVGRLARRFGWTTSDDPVVEADLGALFPQARLDDALPPHDLPRPAHLPRPPAGLRRLSGGRTVPLLRDRRDRSAAGRQAGQGPGVTEAGGAPATLPAWFEPLLRVARTAGAEQISRFGAPPGHHRRSAVLLLFGVGPHGPDVLLTERAPGLRSHPGQVSFPGVAWSRRTPAPPRPRSGRRRRRPGSTRRAWSSSRRCPTSTCP